MRHGRRRRKKSDEALSQSRRSSHPLLYSRGHTILIIGQSNRPTLGLQLLAGISHDKRDSSEGKHLQVIIVITDGHDLLARDTPMARPPLQRMSLRAVAVQHIHN